jgi:hypothetical protein
LPENIGRVPASLLLRELTKWPEGTGHVNWTVGRALANLKLVAIEPIIVCRFMLALLFLIALATFSSASEAQTFAHNASASSKVRKYEYVFVDQTIFVYDTGDRYRLVDTISLPRMRGIRGVAANSRTHMLFVSYGPDSDAGQGHLIKYDLTVRRVVWDRVYPFGIDSMAITRNGKTIYMPTGELSVHGDWKVIRADSGEVIDTISAGKGPHNTIVGPSGRWVYLGPRNDNYLYIASTATHRIVRKVGPMVSGVRPFTVNGRETIAYTTATGFLGFQVSNLKTGRVLYKVPIAGFAWDPRTFGQSAPSHGIALSPGERRLWVMDAPNSYVHVFDVSHVPARAPRQIADVRLSLPMSGQESPCTYDCARDGWLQSSRDGRSVYVGDNGAVIDARTHRIVASLQAMRNSRKSLEIWWRGGLPVFAGSRSSVGYVLPKVRG